MKYFTIISLAILALFSLNACTGENTNKQAEYDATKKMVVDILQTEDGKKALTEIISDEEMKEELIMDSDTVKKAINEAVSSDKGKEMWKKLFDDPKFVKKFAEVTKDEQSKLMKDLMSDPDYQGKMHDLLQDPEMVKQTMKLLKSKEFTEHLQKTIQETIENPIFQAKIQEILLKAAEKQGSGSEESKPQDGGSGSGSKDKGGEESSGGSS